MARLYPKASIPYPLKAGGSWASTSKPRLGWHTTETAGFYEPSKTATGGGSPYHIQVRDMGDHAQVRQYIDLDYSGYALRNGDGGVETNRVGAPNVQVAIVGYARDSQDLPSYMIEALAEIVAYMYLECGVPITAPTFQGSAAYGVGGVGRLGNSEWLALSGSYGHQDVPDGNTHWDPGFLPWAKIEERAKALVEGEMALSAAEEGFVKDMYAASQALTPPTNGFFVRYVVAWFRTLSGLSPEVLAELEESDEIAAVEAKIAELASGIPFGATVKLVKA